MSGNNEIMSICPFISLVFTKRRRSDFELYTYHGAFNWATGSYKLHLMTSSSFHNMANPAMSFYSSDANGSEGDSLRQY